MSPAFEALIIPHRSLSVSGLRWVVGALGLLSAGLSIGLYLAGAWPVTGFCGAEVLLAVWLLRRNARTGQASEMLLLTEAGMRIIRTGRGGQRQEAALPAAWLRTVLEERPATTPRLLLTAPGRCIEIGTALNAEEKRDLAEALRAALHRMRHPVFENPQLDGPQLDGPQLDGPQLDGPQPDAAA